jgi:hypothetical protein
MNKWLEEREQRSVAVAVLLLVVQGLGWKPSRMQPHPQVFQKQDQQQGNLGAWGCMGNLSPTRPADPQHKFVPDKLVLYCDVAVKMRVCTVQNTVFLSVLKPVWLYLIRQYMRKACAVR